MGTIRGKTLFDIFHRFGTPAPSIRAWLTILGILLYALSGPAAVADANAKNVLVVYSSTAGDPHFVSLIEPAIRARVREPINFYAAYLVDTDTAKERKSYLESQAETFRHTYPGVKLDLVIAVSPEAVYFALEYRNKIFPDIPIVFVEVTEKEFGARTWPGGVTGMTIPDGVRETVDLALHLEPDTTTIAVIGAPDPLWLSIVRSDLLRRQVRTIYLIEPPSRELIEKVNALPSHTVVLFQLPPQDAKQLTIGTDEVLDAVAQRVPTYSEFPTICLNHGCIGGAYGDGPKQDASIVELAARVLAGGRPDDIPIVHNSNFQIMLDWRTLQRWHIPESALPPGSLILYRPPTFWEQYRKYLIAAIALIAVLLLLIVGLLWQRARRRKAEAVMREAEERFRVMADSTPSLVWMCDPRGKITYLNERRMAFTGPDLKAGYGDSWAAYVHPDDVKGILDRLSQALKERQPFSMEYRLRRSDGVHRQMFDIASPRMNGDGSFCRIYRFGH